MRLAVEHHADLQRGQAGILRALLEVNELDVPDFGAVDEWQEAYKDSMGEAPPRRFKRKELILRMAAKSLGL